MFKENFFSNPPTKPKEDNKKESRVEELKNKTPDLSRSNILRNIKSYKNFTELINEREKTSILIIGLGRLEEPLGYLSSYYNNKNSFSGLEVTLVDIQKKDKFQEFANRNETYSLGRNFYGSLREPPDSIKKAFIVEEESKEFIAKNIIREKLKEVIEKNGHYEISIGEESEMRTSDIKNQKYNFVSSNNVLQYIEEENLKPTIDRLLKLVDDNGIISIITQNNMVTGIIQTYMKEEYSKEFERIGKGIYIKLSKFKNSKI